VAAGGQQTPFFPLGGGLDLVTPAMAMKPGKVVAALNYESAAGGYQRLTGYERYDGRLAPSDAPYYQFNFDTGTASFVLGDTITGLTSGATAKVLQTGTVLTGTFSASNAAGYVGVGAVSGTFIDNEALRVGGITRANADGAPLFNVAPTDVLASAWQLQATTNARALITAVPGSGPVRGVWTYAGKKYAWRNNAGGTACVCHVNSLSGWVAVAHARTLVFTSGGTYEVAEGNTVTGAVSGATGIVRRVALTSGTWAAGTAAGTFTIDTQAGTFQAENLNVGANLNVATIAGNSALHSFPAGGRYELINHNFYGGISTLRMYGVNGVGQAFEFDGTTIVPISSGRTLARDTPHRIAVHRMHLILGFPGGEFTGSQPGEPLRYDGVLGSFTIGLGDEITDFISGTTSILTVLGANGISNLYGSDASDFQLERLTEEAGALPWTAEKMGTPIYMDNRGVRGMASSQAYGNFELGTLTSMAKPLFSGLRKAKVEPVGAMRLRSKDQYRVFFANKQGVILYLGKKDPEVMPFNYNKLITCVCSNEGTDLNEEAFFGSDDGFVYQMERGTSFDGATIDYFLRIPFNHVGSPQYRKRWHKAVVECEAAPYTTLRVSADFDYGDPETLPTEGLNFTVSGGGGQWDADNWNEFYWSSALAGLAEAYLDGVGRNMSLLIAGTASTEPSHLLQGVSLFYSMRGLQR